MWSLSDANVEILLAVLPLALFMFLLTFFGGQYCVPTLRLHKKQLRFVVTVCFIGCVFGLLYYHYEPPDGLDEGLAIVKSSAWRRGATVDCDLAVRNEPGVKVKILSYADGHKSMDLATISAKVNAEYARLHGFAFHVYRDCRPARRHLQWTKIALLYHELQAPSLPEWLIFVDADEVFAEHDYDVYQQFLSRLPLETALVVAEDVGGHMPINTGFMAVRTGHSRAKELMRTIWNAGRELKLMRAWFHEQGSLTHLVATQSWVAAATVVLGGKWDEESGALRVKMYTDGTLKKREFPAEVFAWRPGDTVAHAIGPKAGGTDKKKALIELEEYVVKGGKKGFLKTS